jgi:hypothetical protein
VPAVVELTVSQKILLAAYHLEDKGQTPFTAEALTVTAWKESPRTFGLKGFVEEHPDANKVLACIMGERGLARRGWLLKMGQKLYQLSKQGREEARRVLAGDESPLPKRRALAQIKVPKELDTHLKTLFRTNAWRRFNDGMRREITFPDAKQFWGLGDNVHGEAVDEVLRKVPATLEEVERLVIGDTVELSDGQTVTAEQLQALQNAHKFLTEQFSRHLDQQRQRTRRF